MPRPLQIRRPIAPIHIIFSLMRSYTPSCSHVHVGTPAIDLYTGAKLYNRGQGGVYRSNDHVISIYRSTYRMQDCGVGEITNCGTPSLRKTPTRI